MKKIILVGIFILSSTFLIHGIFTVSMDGNYEYEVSKGSYNSGRLVNVTDIRDEIASLSINGERALLKEGETYEIKNPKSQYAGSIEIKSIEGDSVLVEVDVEKTKYFLVNVILALLFSLLAALMVGGMFSMRNDSGNSKKNVKSPHTSG